MKNVKNKEFLTSSQLEIHYNSVSKIFDPFLSQIKGYVEFESKSHHHNSNQQIFQGDRIRGSLFCNYRELYHTITEDCKPLGTGYDLACTSNRVAFPRGLIMDDVQANRKNLEQSTISWCKQKGCTCYKILSLDLQPYKGILFQAWMFTFWVSPSHNGLQA